MFAGIGDKPNIVSRDQEKVLEASSKNEKMEIGVSNVAKNKIKIRSSGKFSSVTPGKTAMLSIGDRISFDAHENSPSHSCENALLKLSKYLLTSNVELENEKKTGISK